MRQNLLPRSKVAVYIILIMYPRKVPGVDATKSASPKTASLAHAGDTISAGRGTTTYHFRGFPRQFRMGFAKKSPGDSMKSDLGPTGNPRTTGNATTGIAQSKPIRDPERQPFPRSQAKGQFESSGPPRRRRRARPQNSARARELARKRCRADQRRSHPLNARATAARHSHSRSSHVSRQSRAQRCSRESLSREFQVYPMKSNSP